jgi:hypothetical protein
VENRISSAWQDIDKNIIGKMYFINSYPKDMARPKRAPPGDRLPATTTG